MLKCKAGRINNIIYLNTTYQDSKCRIYPTLTDLFRLLREIIRTEETTGSIQITPFYINEKLDFQEELDIGVFYLECADTVTVEKKDITGFQDSISIYMNYLMIRGIPQMMVWLYDMTILDVESLPYGYFCFEILSK